MAQGIFNQQGASLRQPDGEAMQKALDLGGQIKLDHSLFAENENAGLNQLKYSSQGEKSSGLSDQLKVQIWGEHEWGRLQFCWKIDSSVLRGDLEMEKENKKENKIEEACIIWQPAPELRWYAGKKVFSWGKSHAWNPLGFLDSPRDPLDPDLPHTGLISLGAEYGQEFPPGPDPLQGLTFTSLIFPVQEKINKDFGHWKHWNLASKLSLLFWNTEIDFVALTGKSRPDLYGFDFSRTLSTSLEMYGDFWVSPQYEKVFLDQSGTLWETEYTAFGSLGGLRYERGNMCWTVEYYRNKAGFTPEEMLSYYHYLQTVVDAYPKKGADEAGQRMLILTNAYYQRPDLMQEYAYTQILKKDPFRIQHLSCSIAGVWNLQDQSLALCPELQYDSKPNLNIGLKTIFWKGDPHTEFGEKANHWAVEASLTYFFEFSFYYLPSTDEPRQDPSDTMYYR